VLREAVATLHAGHPLAEVSLALLRLPDARNAPRDVRARRARAKNAAQERLASLLDASPEIAAAVDDVLARANGSVDTLDAVLRDQSYRLADWRVAADEINYRRFFDIHELAAIRMEDPDVFAAMHGVVLRLVAERRLDGIRLDHTDGLYDPAGYFRDLQREAAAARDASERGQTYLVAEKILEPGEVLPPDWRIEGTTGYDFLADVGGLWVDPAAEPAMTLLCQEATGERVRFEEVATDAKRGILGSTLASEVSMLARALERLASARRRSRDFTLRSLTNALVETLAAFPVYRTYVRSDGVRESGDERHVKVAVARAKRRCPDESPTVFDFLEDMLLLRAREPVPDEERAAQVRFAMRFQQLSGPVMAKGVEDTAFYRDARLLSLNEVGGSPAAFGTPVARFHAANIDRRERWPQSMLATSTHDTKRGEDARARLSVLSEVTDRWREHVAVWEDVARSDGRPEGNPDVPSWGDEAAVTPSDRYYFYQSVVGALPLDVPPEGPIPSAFVDRTCAHMAKATKEKKRETRWTQPNEAYDRAVQRFARDMLEDPRFCASLVAFVRSIARAGATNGLAQAVLKLTSPGVPDVYQGTELWSFDFCDPDNRRPVDYAARRAQLHGIRATGDKAALGAELLERFEDGRVKMLVIHTLLCLRRQAPGLFLEGSYERLDAHGAAKEHVVAFAREAAGRRLVTAVPRHAATVVHGEDRWPVGAAWGSATLALPPGGYIDVFTGQVVTSNGSAPLRNLFDVLPVAVLMTDR
jgi:(1->4)-alpha-D-glucan 1-alpha-D-glucosylmutase